MAKVVNEQVKEKNAGWKEAKEEHHHLFLSAKFEKERYGSTFKIYSKPFSFHTES